MKSGVLAASIAIGIAALIPAAFAQGDGSASATRASQPQGSTATSSAVVPSTVAPTLQSDRAPAGMLPQRQAGPPRQLTATDSDWRGESSDLRRSLRRE